MESIYYSIMLLGVAWICVWAAVDKPDPGFGWWPFDMLEDAPKEEQEAIAAGRRPAGRAPRGPAAAPDRPGPVPTASWRGRVTGGRRAAPDAPAAADARPGGAGRRGQPPRRPWR